MYIETKSEQGSLPLLVHLQNDHISSRKVESWLVENKIYIPKLREKYLNFLKCNKCQKRKDKRNKKNQIKEKNIKVEDKKENEREVSEYERDLIEENDDEILCEDDEIPCGQPISSEEDEPTPLSSQMELPSSQMELPSSQISIPLLRPETTPKNFISENVIDLSLYILFHFNEFVENDIFSTYKISIIKILYLTNFNPKHLIDQDYIFIFVDSRFYKYNNSTILQHFDPIIQSLNIEDYSKYTFVIQEQLKLNNNCGFFLVLNLMVIIKYIINFNSKCIVSNNKLQINSEMYCFYPEDFRNIIHNTLIEFYKLDEYSKSNLIDCFKSQIQNKINIIYSSENNIQSKIKKTFINMPKKN
ncbi:hypothetical protein ACTFIT_001932 [Dictyostelium discoideum]